MMLIADKPTATNPMPTDSAGAGEAGSPARKPKIVIVMPAYNAALTLEKTYYALPEGSYDQIILVDDAGGDRTTEIGRELVRASPRSPCTTPLSQRKYRTVAGSSRCSFSHASHRSMFSHHFGGAILTFAQYEHQLSFRVLRPEQKSQAPRTLLSARGPSS
jgi:cellulose synthase/poly-beta-1,6-N-acetylglucosamine synthase-like glycosyltransferase